PADRVVLDYDDRFRRRIVLRGVKGTRFLLELPEPRLLMDGDGLRLDTGAIVAVEAAAEDLAEITCGDARELVRVAWHLGNRHLPAQLMEGRIRIRQDHVIIDMVRQLGASVELIKAPFQPESGAYGQAQAHGHDHGHSHSHSHDHHHDDHAHHHHHHHHGHSRD
ncbi:MAG: urease accessory protein UreE, partial [Hyphomicrobiales bacterium]